MHRDDVLPLEEMWYDLVSRKCEGWLLIPLVPLARTHSLLYLSLDHALTHSRSLSLSRCRARTHRQQALKSTEESNAKFRSPHHDLCVSSCYYTCVLILLCMCPHTVVYESTAKFRSPQLLHVSSYCYICVLIPLWICPQG